MAKEVHFHFAVLFCFSATGLDIGFLNSWMRVPCTAPAQDGVHWPLALEPEGLRAHSQVCHSTVGTEGEKGASVLGARDPQVLLK